jgi:flagellar biosynthesis/type III secretory pathway protein FliH
MCEESYIEGFDETFKQKLEEAYKQGFDEGYQETIRKIIQKLLLIKMFTVEQIAEIADVSVDFILTIEADIE